MVELQVRHRRQERHRRVVHVRPIPLHTEQPDRVQRLNMTHMHQQVERDQLRHRVPVRRNKPRPLHTPLKVPERRVLPQQRLPRRPHIRTAPHKPKHVHPRQRVRIPLPTKVRPLPVHKPLPLRKQLGKGLLRGHVLLREHHHLRIAQLRLPLVHTHVPAEPTKQPRCHPRRRQQMRVMMMRPTSVLPTIIMSRRGERGSGAGISNIVDGHNNGASRWDEAHPPSLIYPPFPPLPA